MTASAAPLNYESFVAQVMDILRDQPATAGLDDGGVGGYYYLEEGFLLACHGTDGREECAVQVDSSAWDDERGYFEGYTAEDAQRCLARRKIVALADYPA